MASLTTVLLFALATFILTVSPGPGVLYVSARALSQGRRAGFASMFGIESGEVIWLAAAATGLAALLATSAGALTFLRYGGAAYLIYLGVRRWREHRSFIPPQRSSLPRIFAQGLLTQLLNPKVAVFFIAFLPHFIDPTQSIAPQVMVLGAVYIAVALLVDTTYVFAAAAISRRFMESKVAQRRAGQVAAGTYIALGVAAAVTGDRPA